MIYSAIRDGVVVIRDLDLHLEFEVPSCYDRRIEVRETRTGSAAARWVHDLPDAVISTFTLGQRLYGVYVHLHPTKHPVATCITHSYNRKFKIARRDACDAARRGGAPRAFQDHQSELKRHVNPRVLAVDNGGWTSVLKAHAFEIGRAHV